jgi:hypothetical protein
MYEVIGNQVLMGARFFPKAHYTARITDSGSTLGVGG